MAGVTHACMQDVALQSHDVIEPAHWVYIIERTSARPAGVFSWSKSATLKLNCDVIRPGIIRASLSEPHLSSACVNVLSLGVCLTRARLLTNVRKGVYMRFQALLDILAPLRLGPV